MNRHTVNRSKKAAIILHDVVMTALAMTLALYLRFDEARVAERVDALPLVLAGLLPAAAFAYRWFGLYDAKWRFASLPDLLNILRAASVLAVGLLAVDYVLVSPMVLGEFFFGKVWILAYWMIQVFLLSGPRIAYRAFKDRRRARKRARAADGPAPEPALVLGRSSEAEPVLRALEIAGSGMRAIGLVSPRIADAGQTLRGVPVLGTLAEIERVLDDLERGGQRPQRLVLCPSVLQAKDLADAAYAAARRHGVALARAQPIEEDDAPARIAPLAMEDLLLRPTVAIEMARLEGLVAGRRIAVTGGGGSIGAEIVRRLVKLGADEVLVIENAEPALYTVVEGAAALGARTSVTGALCDVRERARLQAVLDGFRPDLVFHAAALKHVHVLERDWGEGIKTNVLGSANVADATLRCGARAMVMISTDKAVEPVSILGATKRLAEMYVQALDARLEATDPRPDRQRLIAVRFGNVLGSQGSVVPKFKAQIERGGPITVTHADMVRYFMTIPEAANLVITACAHAVADAGHATSVYVLNMGQPVHILDLAKRMARLAGLEPGRDIAIEVTGLRPGERLREIVLGQDEPTVPIGVDGVVAARPAFGDLARVQAWMRRLAEAVAADDREAAAEVLHRALPTFPAPRARPGAGGGIGMHLVQILLPLTDNAGHALPSAEHARVGAELTARFGGLTAHTRAPAEGLWTDGGRRASRDEIVVFEVMVERLDAVWWCAYRRDLERRFRQDLVIVRAQSILLL